MVQHMSSVDDVESAAANGKSKAIPLPPPPSSQFTNGNAYGGNQSFVQSSSDMVMGAPLITGTSNYWDASAVAGSSNGGARIPGVVGLTNIGNTCFMNSGLQCLLNTPSICEFFLKSKPFSSASQKFSLLNHFQYVVKQAWQGSSGKINLQEFKSCLAAIHSQFNDSRQHDCQEFLALLLDSLHEQLKKWSESENSLELSKSSRINIENSSSNTENKRPQTPSSWISDETAASSENRIVASSGKEISVTHSKGIKQSNLSDVFSQNRKQSALSLRSNETVSKSKITGTCMTHSRNPVHSALKSPQNIRTRVRTRLNTFEGKYNKYQNKNTRLRGATTSLFQLPNFTPSGYASYISRDKDVSSTSSDSTTMKWMDLKNSCGFGKYVSRNRKKKFEDAESPGSPKKTRFDLHAASSTTDTKRKVNFVEETIDKQNDPDRSQRYQLKHSRKEDSSSISTHLFNGTRSCNNSSNSSDIESSEDASMRMKKPPRKPNKADEAERAKTFWGNHINANNTVIAKTFQGLLKSTVICATCGYNSVTYEPFMYLSLPFPRVLERKLGIWFISMKDRRPVKLEVAVGVMDTVRKVKQEVGKLIAGEEFNESAAEKLLLAEICNYSVHRLIGNSTLVRKLNDNRNLYVFQLNENFDEKYGSCISKDGSSYSFTNSFLNSDSLNSVSSTTHGQMNASTYLDEDWDHDPKLTVGEGAPEVKEPYGPTLPCGSMEAKEPLVDLDWYEPETPCDAAATAVLGDSSETAGAVEPRSPLADPEADSERRNNVDKLPCMVEVGSSGESNGTADTTWSDDVCSLEAGSSEADDSGLGSGTSDTAESAIVGGTCDATDIGGESVDFGLPGVTEDSPPCAEGVTAGDVTSADENSDVPELTPCSVSGINDSSEDPLVTGVIEPLEVDTSADPEISKGSIENKSEGVITNGSEPEIDKEQLSGFPTSVTSSAGTTDMRSWKSETKSESIQSTTMQCIICLEDCLLSDMRQHTGCDCVICSNCVKSSIQHFVDAKEPSSTKSKLKCATCMKTVHGSEFVQYRPVDGGSTKLTMEIVPLLFRLDPNPDANNNSFPVPRIFGYPWLLKLPSSLPAQEFYDYISEINPFPMAQFKVITVSSDGKSCGQCGYASSCSGCELPKVGDISFRYRTSLAISYSELSVESLSSIEPTDMAIEEHSFGSSSWATPGEPNYDIHDCLRAFSEMLGEHLDEQNPWFCPHCEKNQCATKALSVCHFPDYLIVYLKRFVFLDHSSNKLNNKLKFPISELDLSEYIAEEFSGKEWNYDLYGCICHFGSVSSGHYTAYGKNPVSGDWHYFNDDIVSQQCPKDLEHSSAYVLFYSRKGVKYDIPLQTKVRPLPGLNTLAASRPVNIVAPTNSADEPWEPEDEEEVSSSSTDYSFQPQPVHCNFSGGTGGTVEEMSLSVGTSNPAMSLWPTERNDDENCWDKEKEDAIATGDYNLDGGKNRSPPLSTGSELGNVNDSGMLMNGQELPDPLQTMSDTVTDDNLFPDTFRMC